MVPEARPSACCHLGLAGWTRSPRPHLSWRQPPPAVPIQPHLLYRRLSCLPQGASRSLPCAHLLMSLKPAIRSLKTLAPKTASPPTNPTYLLKYLSSMSVVVVNMAPHLGRLLASRHA